MSTSHHGRAATALGHRWLNDPQRAWRLAEADSYVRDPQLTKLVSVFGQPFRGWDHGQLAALFLLVRMWERGELVMAVAEVGTQPWKDAGRRANQKDLDGLAADGIVVTVHDQEMADCDGDVSWAGSIPGWCAGPDGDLLRQDLEPWSHAPLEIGTTAPSSTYLHLALSGFVARWPYGSTKLAVLACRPFDVISSQVQSLLHESAR